jgi:hypothetical protein
VLNTIVVGANSFANWDAPMVNAMMVGLNYRF